MEIPEARGSTAPINCHKAYKGRGRGGRTRRAKGANEDQNCSARRGLNNARTQLVPRSRDPRKWLGRGECQRGGEGLAFAGGVCSIVRPPVVRQKYNRYSLLQREIKDRSMERLTMGQAVALYSCSRSLLHPDTRRNPLCQ